jgi:hypothetical protein
MDILELFLVVTAIGYLWSQLAATKQRVRRLEERLEADAIARAKGQTAPAGMPSAIEPARAPAPVAPAIPVSVDPPAPIVPVAPAGATAPVAPVAPPVMPQTPVTPSPAPAGPPQWQVSLFDLLRRNLFAVAGVVLLLLGFVVLFRSIEWGHLLPPIAKVSLAWAAAAALGFAGVRLSARNGLWGQVVEGGAAAIGYLATYVGSSGYEVLPPSAALALFAAISGALVHRALKEDAKVLAGVGFLGAYAAPLLALYGHAGLLFNLGYGLIVTAFALWVSLHRRWLEIGIHAHVCAAGLASLAWAAASHEPALPAWQQQGLLLAYLAQFSGWTLAWAHRRLQGAAAADRAGAQARAHETPIVSACFSMTVVVFLAMEGWLLTPNAFTAVAFVTAAALGALTVRGFPLQALRETAWVLSALSVAVGLAQNELATSVSSLGLFAEGAILMLATGSQSRLRRVVARGLMLLGAINVLLLPGWWPAAMLLLAGLALSLRMARVDRATDAGLAASVTVAAAAAFSYRHAGLTMDAVPVFVLVMLSATVLAYVLNRSASGAEGTTSVLVPRIYAVVLALGWLSMLPMLPALPRVLGLSALAMPSVAGAVMAVVSMRRPISGRAAELAKALLCNLHLLPALVAFALDASAAVVALLAVTGTAVFAHVLGRLRADTPPGTAAQLTPASAAHAALIGALLPLLLAASSGALVWVLSGAAFYAALLTWWKLGDGVPAQARQVAVAAAAVAVGYVVARGLTDSPAQAFELAWRSYLLPVALAAVGVSCLFLSTRGGRRLAWQVSAVVCTGAMVKLLLSLGSLALSPMGIVGSLLGMGALFLLAGYLAPQPPGREASGPAAS